MKLQFDNLQGFTSAGNQIRNKRPASAAFEKDEIPQVSPEVAIGQQTEDNKVTAGFGDYVGVQDLSNQLMAHILGLDVNPAVVDSANTHMPGYRWCSDQGGGIQPRPEGFAGDPWSVDGSFLGMDLSFGGYEPQPMSGGGYAYVVPPPQEGLVYYNVQDLM